MLKVLLVGVVSVVPGLGFFILRRYRTSIFSFLSVISLVLFSGFIPWDGLREFCFALGFIIWVFQIVYAIKFALAEKSQEDGTSFSPNEEYEKIRIPKEIPIKERLVYKVRESIKRQLMMGETLIAGVYANTGKYSHYHIGLTETHLLIIEIDLMDKPIDVKRIPISDITLAEKKGSFLVEVLKISREGAKTKKYQIASMQKNQLQTMVDKLNQQISVIETA